MSDKRSPRTCSGSRTLALSMSKKVRFSSPESTIFMCGTSNPSSYTVVASAEKPLPPMSITWQVDAKNPTSFCSRNAGVTMTKSNRCPVPSHGSLVA